MTRPALPTIAVSLGDPGGIGPEVTAKALQDPHVRGLARWRLLGPAKVWQESCARVGLAAEDAAAVEFVPASPSQGQTYDQLAMGFGPRPTIGGGACSFAAVFDAIDLAKRPVGDPTRADAIVTAPISKEAWALAGHRYPGHTELLAERFQVPDAKMFFHCPLPELAGRTGPHSLNVMLVTVHVPLAGVAGMLTIGLVLNAIRAGSHACKALGIATPRIAVCGLNPHAGENGLLGHEEQEFINPAIEIAREDGFLITGPWPGDTIFNRAVRGDFDLVVALYHDQGLIPVKLLGWDRAVNVTVGLPVPRTSPDHGTAFDIAGQGLADEGSMRSAMLLAVRMCAGTSSLPIA